MAPFANPELFANGIKERIESITVQGDRLYAGTSTGTLHIYSLDENLENEEGNTRLVESKKAFTRRSIEQVGVIKDINSLVVLSETQVILYPLPALGPPTPLTKAKAAFSFAINSSIQEESPNVKDVDGDFGTRSKPIPTVVTQLVVGCRRKMVVYSWRDGEPQEPRETPLPHSARTTTFINNETLCLAYSPTEYAVFSLETFTVSEVSTPLTTAVSATGMGAFTGLTGYMTLGLGAKSKPAVSAIGVSEVLISKDNEGYILGIDGKPSRSSTVGWPAPPEEIAFVKPYIFSVLPPGTVPTSQTISSTSTTTAPPQPSYIPTSVVQIRSSITLLPSQTVVIATSQEPSSAALTASSCTIRLLTASPSAKSPLFLLTTPTDRAVATAEGSTIWKIRMKSWGEQVDELVQSGSYTDALALLDTIEEVVLPDKEQRRIRIRALNAVSDFRSGKYDDAINAFIDLDLNPAKVVALYPESVAGRLSVPQDAWIPLFGGSVPVDDSSSDKSEKGSTETKDSNDDIQQAPSVAPEGLVRAATPTGSVRHKLKTGIGALLPHGPKDDDTASLSGKPKRSDSQRSIETLLRYLTDRRPKVAGALAAVHITPAQSHSLSFLSETSTEDLFALPNASLSSLTPEQLLRFAQIVDTALFKSYLLTRPGLLGPLCRVANWCEVSEVEEELRSREKFAELIYLYNGKKMHAKALDLLKHLSEKETDMSDKLAPSVSYLQKLGPEHLDQIFQSSRWIFEQDRDMAFEIFTSEDVELPRSSVADYLHGIDPQICSRYLEYLIGERGEDSPAFHDRLAELYLSMTLTARKRGDEKLRKSTYSKLLHFIDTTHHYRIDRLYGIMSSEDLFEARAILLGRLGRHDQALELYVYRLQDYLKAEEYCKRVYQANTETNNVFLTLLRIYLRPTVKTSANLLSPALDLISRHSPRLDSLEALNLLPPLVTAGDVRAFLVEALRAPIFDTQVVREISKSRDDQVARKLMQLQTKRVKVTDSRICPQCHKRIGSSVIAVHAPRGEVTHYQCREAFSRKLLETRH